MKTKVIYAFGAKPETAVTREKTLVDEAQQVEAMEQEKEFNLGGDAVSMFLFNDRSFYNEILRPIVERLQVKELTGSYDKDKALKIYSNVADAAYKKYKGIGVIKQWTDKERDYAAKQMERYYYDIYIKDFKPQSDDDAGIDWFINPEINIDELLAECL